MGVDNAGKSYVLSLMRFRQKIIILCENDAPQFSCSIQQGCIWLACHAIFLRGQYIDAA